MNADHVQLLYFSEIMWLSRGSARNRLVELCHEVEEFPKEKQYPLFGYLSNGSFITVLAYMTDIFIFLNQLNSLLQRKCISVFVICDNMGAFKMKIWPWKNTMKEGSVSMFHSLSVGMRCEVSVIITTDHMTKLQDQLESTFNMTSESRRTGSCTHS